MVQIISGQGRSADSLKFVIPDGLANRTAVRCPSIWHNFMVRGGAVSIALVFLSYHVMGYAPRLVCEWCNRVDGSPVTMYGVKNELWHLFINIYH